MHPRVTISRVCANKQTPDVQPQDVPVRRAVVSAYWSRAANLVVKRSHSKGFFLADFKSARDAREPRDAPRPGHTLDTMISPSTVALAGTLCVIRRQAVRTNMLHPLFAGSRVGDARWYSRRRAWLEQWTSTDTRRQAAGC